jgi:translation initiation factor 2 beta subunit (eIF-2beta)/eIF-5
MDTHGQRSDAKILILQRCKSRDKISNKIRDICDNRYVLLLTAVEDIASTVPSQRHEERMPLINPRITGRISLRLG